MPDFAAYVRRNLRLVGVPGDREAEIVEELALEFQENYERALRSGLTDAQAWQQVRERGRPWQELAAELRWALDEPAAPPEPERPASAPVRWLEGFRRDLRFGARQLRRSPGFTTVAVLMLALGIGGNTAIFSLLHAILLRSLPVRHAEQLVFLGDAQAEGSTSSLSGTKAFSYPFFREFRERNQVFSDVAAIQSHIVESHGRLGGDREMEKIRVEMVSGTYFPTLRVTPARGRLFTDADDRRPGGHPLAVASYSWWRSRLGGDPAVTGRTVTINSTVYTIVGVAAPGFFGVTVGQSPDLWIPLAMQREILPDHNGLEDVRHQSLHMLARLKPGVTMARAQAHSDLLFHQIAHGFAGPQASQELLARISHAHLELTPAATGRSRLRKEFGSPLEILMAVVALVLLIACANVANLLLVRAAARRREIAVRMSLGAERRRLIRQLLAESGLLAAAGALLGVGLAWSAGRLLLAMVSNGTQLLPLSIAPDLGLLGFTVAVAVLTVFLFGIAPALRATGLDLAGVLRAGRGVPGGTAPGGGRLTRALVVGQVALSVVLLAGAGLFLRSLSNLAHTDVGFDRDNVLRFRIDPTAAGYHTGAELSALYQRIEQRIGGLPGIHGTSIAYYLFDGGGTSTNDIFVPGRVKSDSDPSVDFDFVGADYLGILKIPILAGRGLDRHDTAASAKVAVINETMARTYFGSGSPLGRTFSVGRDPQRQNLEVVGIMKDAKYMEVEEAQMPAAFCPLTQQTEHFLYNLVVRYSGDPAVIAPETRKALAEIDPNLPVGDVRTLSDMVDDFMLNQRLVAELSTFFGILAALLACIGIYGVMSYGIARRTHEFGIRMALGAERADVLWVVLREAALLAAVGAAIGLALALAAGPLVGSLLIGVTAGDPSVLAMAMATMIAVALAAGYVPARRATRIDPSAALRWE